MIKILLVEDTRSLADELVDLLKLENFEVIAVTDGIKALQILSDFVPDLIVTDVLMPAMDGYTLIRHLRAMKPFQSIPIIIHSAKTSDEDKALGLQAGANLCLQKPLKCSELISAINSLVQPGRSS